MSKWKRNDQQSVTGRIGNAIKPQPSLKRSLNLAGRHIELQIQRLDNALQRFSSRDTTIFTCIVKAQSARDKLRANMLANELAELRNVEKVLTQTKLALESISIRLKTISELGDIVTVLAPAASAIQKLRPGLASVFPQADTELAHLGDLLSNIASSTSQTSNIPINIETANDEAQQIIAEAASMAEQKIKEKLPDIKAEVSVKDQAELNV